MNSKLKKLLPIFFIITLLPLKGLLGRGITDAHDSISHVVRLYSFYDSLKEGNLVPRWSQHLNYGYGHPIFMFLYPLPNYLASLTHFLGFSIISSIKIVLGLSFFLAGVFAYFWFKELFGTWPALLGAAVFQLAPYRFVNLYVRNAFGENTATLFIPLVFWMFTKLSRTPNRKYLILTGLSLAGLLLSHNAISLMVLPLLLAYILILIFFSQTKLHSLRYSLAAGLMGLGLSTFFWLPAFIEGKYTLREIVMRGDTFADHFPTLKQLIIPFWGYGVSAPPIHPDGMSFQVGPIQWLVLFTPLIFLKSKKFLTRSKILTLIFYVTFLFSVFIMLPTSLPIWKLITVIKKFQFPWRWLTLTITTSGFLAAAMAYYSKLNPKLILLLIALLVFETGWYWHPKGFLPQSEEELIHSYTGTTDTGESTPLWAIRFQEQSSPGGLSVVWGAPIKYQIIHRLAEVHEYKVTTTTTTQISDNTLYFPGWKVYIDNQKVPITYADPNWRGEITFPVPIGTHHIKVVFEETKLRLFADTLSLFSGIILLTLVCFSSIRKYVHT